MARGVIAMMLCIAIEERERERAIQSDNLLQKPKQEKGEGKEKRGEVMRSSPDLADPIRSVGRQRRWRLCDGSPDKGGGILRTVLVLLHSTTHAASRVMSMACTFPRGLSLDACDV